MQLTRGKDEAVSPSLQRQAVLRQNSAERLPVLRILQIGKAVALYPAGQRFNISSFFHIDRRIGPGLRSERVIIHGQPILPFQFGTDTSQLPMIIEGLMNSQLFRMNLVDGDVQVEVFRIAVQNRHALVSSIAKAFAKPLFDLRNLLRGGVLPFLKADHTVVGLIALRTCVLLLYGQHFHARPCRVFRLASRYANALYPVAAPLRICKVGNQPGNAAF